MKHDLLRLVPPYVWRWVDWLAGKAYRLFARLHVTVSFAVALGLTLQAAFVGLPLGLLLGGAGHGIFAPLWVSWAFLVGAVGLPAWWFLRRRRFGVFLGLALLAVWLAADCLLVVWTWGETDGLARVWRVGPAGVVMWYTFWLIPQAALIWLMIRSASESRAPSATPDPGV